MAKIKLHVFPPSPNGRMVLIAAAEAGVDADICTVDLFKREHEKPEFLALNPNGLMPVLEDGDFVLWESTAIMQYLAARQPGRSLWPEDAKAQADVSRWLSWRLAHWGPTCGIFAFQNLVKPLSGLGDPDPAEIARGEGAMAKLGRILDDQLAGKSFITGDQITLADIAIGSWLTHCEQTKIPIAGFSEVMRWRESLEGREAWKKSAPSL